MTVSRLKTRLLAVTLCAAAFLTAAAGFGLALRADRHSTRVIGQKGTPEETAARFFNALCLREWDEASGYVLGAPDLALNVEPQDALARQVWLAYQRSWSWSMGEGGQTDSVSAWQTVRFSALRPEKLAEGLSKDVQSVLARIVDETDNLDAVYAEDGEFRAEVVERALREAVERRLTAPQRYTADTEVTLHLTCRYGRWLIVPEEALWEALSGGEGGTA